MHVFLNRNHYYNICYNSDSDSVICYNNCYNNSTLTNSLLIFKILFNFFLKLYPGYGFVYLSFSKYYVCFYA